MPDIDFSEFRLFEAIFRGVLLLDSHLTDREGSSKTALNHSLLTSLGDEMMRSWISTGIALTAITVFGGTVPSVPQAEAARPHIQPKPPFSVRTGRSRNDAPQILREVFGGVSSIISAATQNNGGGFNGGGFNGGGFNGGGYNGGNNGGNNGGGYNGGGYNGSYSDGSYSDGSYSDDGNNGDGFYQQGDEGYEGFRLPGNRQTLRAPRRVPSQNSRSSAFRHR